MSRYLSTKAVQVHIEPQRGGLYLVSVTYARLVRGSFREVVPMHRLAYSFGWNGSEAVPSGPSLVAIDLIERPEENADPPDPRPPTQSRSMA